MSIERQKSLLNIALANDNIRLTAAIHAEVSQITKGIDALRTKQEDDQRRQSLARLSTIDITAIHGDISANRTSGTGEWLLRSKEFESWFESSSHSTLWCRGMPGAGKTILSSLTLDHLNSLKEFNTSIGVSGTYCSYRDPQSILNIMGSILQQLAQDLKQLPSLVAKHETLTLDDVRSALVDAISRCSQVFVVIDALDECDLRLDLLNELQQLLQRASRMFNLNL